MLFQDLGVYMRQNLTEPTRKCGALGVISHQLMRNCLQRIGFSSDCIPIWEYNILNTKKECTAVSAAVDQILDGLFLLTPGSHLSCTVLTQSFTLLKS